MIIAYLVFCVYLDMVDVHEIFVINLEVQQIDVTDRTIDDLIVLLLHPITMVCSKNRLYL